MSEYKIKLDKKQIRNVLNAYVEKKKSMRIVIKHDDLLANGSNCVIKIGRANLYEIANAFNENRDAVIQFTTSNILSVVYCYKPSLIKRTDQAPATAGLELWSTSDEDLRRYAERLGIEPFSVISIDEPIDTDIGVYNSTRRAEGGMHWCCWYIDEKHNYIFDPFGMPIDTRMIRKIKAENNNKIVRSTLQEQDITESSCGQRCIVLLNELHKAKDAKERFEIFYKHTTTPRNINKEWRKLKLPFNSLAEK